LNLDAFPTALELIGGSPTTERARGVTARASHCGDPVLISAEVGLDPLAVARAIHDGSSRAAGRFASMDCAGQEAAELEQQMFGRARARRADKDDELEWIDQHSLIGSAFGGTFVLANLDELPSQLQGRLARLLRDGQVEIDSTGRGVPLDVRVMATVCGNIEDEIRDGKLRRELCSRFGLRLDLPPLRHRPADIPTLIGCVVAEASAASRVGIPTFSREALSLLAALPWRRNFEELREVLDVLALAAAGGTVHLEDVLGHVPIERMSTRRAGTATLREARVTFEREYIAAVLQRHRGRMDEAARTLGIQRTNLYRKVRQLGLGRARLQK
jgi:DNA-binding NtrC family response regulator